MGDYATDKYALWLDFRMTDENTLHGTGRRIGSAGGGITLKIEKEREVAAQFNIQTEHSILPCTIEMLHMLESHMALFIAPTGVGKMHLALDLLEKEYLNYFDLIIIICSTLKHNETFRNQKWVWTDPCIIQIEPGNH